MAGNASTGLSTTVERPDLSRLTRRSRSQRSSDPSDFPHAPPLSNNPLDAMEQGRVTEVNQEKGSERLSYGRRVITITAACWNYLILFLKRTVRVLLGQNPAWNSAVMVIATYLGILVAISGIFGWPELPLLEVNRRRRPSVIPFGGGIINGGRACHTTTVNNYSPTTVNNYV
ncbi:hypothetical protein QBC40DRAFT_301696 [Triangularia verruculosa]|uniref:Uncharacterized protein n=1 Tax=Triangularia verruculosa TaxID=2587418 RepID=A0AAN6X6P6_9PEZI|nr:hypothetical protein QBC40DRAFT_301696 [Triangularia verruculosa]